MTQLFEVSASWMKACGMGEEAKVFPVLREWQAGHLPMAELALGNGRKWEVVTSWRGKYL